MLEDKIMNQCKICHKELPTTPFALRFHVMEKHYPWLVYLSEHEGNFQFSKTNLIKMYEQEMKSTPIMSEELGVAKILLLKAMHWYNIKMRNVSEATKNQIKRDGLWNKGETKFTHSSVKKYADSRMGDNNPFIKAPGYEQRKLNFANLMKKYRGESPPKPPKSTEIRMTKILDDYKIQFLPQFYVPYNNSWRWYDFVIEGKLILEVHGNYYHANPEMYGPDDIITISHTKKSATEIWAYDKDKKDLAESRGYMFMVIWEKELKKLADIEVADRILTLLNGNGE